MTVTADPLTLDRLESILARMEALAGIEPLAAEVGLQAYPPQVAAGELITSAWGNSVVDNLTIGAHAGGMAITSGQWSGLTPATIGGFNIAAKAHQRYLITGSAVVQMVSGTDIANLLAIYATGAISNFGTSMLHPGMFSTIPIIGVAEVPTAGTARIDLQISVSAATGIMQIIRGWVFALDAGPY